MGTEFLFMVDNAHPHHANIVDEYLQTEDITRMDWPAYSPDLNPIEHVWDMLGRRIAARQPIPTCLPELPRALLDVCKGREKRSRNSRSRLPKSPAGKTASFHPTTKHYRALWNSLYLTNGVLYRKCEFDDGKIFGLQLIITKTRVSTVLKELHGSPTGVHFGVMKTLQKVRERFYWNNMRSDAEKCCGTCDLCAVRKGPRKRTRGRLQLYNV
ncbi:retrovirus-related Pol polyprotein from transposon 412 [Trichonephila clavipes]|nr:retrovirus-related Pol polyprotein from transposon 412 [Trichonephila clavipes]